MTPPTPIVPRMVFKHCRYHDKDGRIEARAGQTIAFMLDPEFINTDTPKVLVGVAMCCPKDNYNRKVGRTIAMARLLSYPKPAASGEYWAFRMALPSSIKDITDMKAISKVVTKTALKYIGNIWSKGEASPPPSASKEEARKKEKAEMDAALNNYRAALLAAESTVTKASCEVI